MNGGRIVNKKERFGLLNRSVTYPVGFMRIKPQSMTFFCVVLFCWLVEKYE